MQEVLIELVKVVGSIILGIITGYFAIRLKVFEIKSNKAQPTKTDLLQNSLKLASEIDEQLFNVLNEIGCDRISIGTFSNGSKFYTGEPMQFINQAFEKVKRGVSPISKDFRRVPISQFAYFYKQFRNIDVAQIHVSKVEDDTYREIMNFYDQKTIYGFIIYSSKNEWVGVLQLNWLEKEVTLTADEIAYIKMKCNIIGDLLENWNKYL